ncbi:DUF2156 domain-containing protein [Inediibacterium massiliense]|uniref:DUF2156 domain-containing protein n=1 Tax=Inediibacterium massiliense TaxID=1658111 RepID=UPI0006B669BF|nr:phosphatidylglycerol lysyltransferase domain-containing protein [Inediibacterium massiliense]
MFQHDITLKDKDLFEKYVFSYPYETSGLSFTSLFMWRQLNEFKYEIINDFLCIGGVSLLNMDKKEPFVLPPLAVGKYDLNKLSITMDEIKKRFDQKGFPFQIKLLPKHLIPTFDEAMQDKLIFTEDRVNFDYVYLTNDLIELKGRKYHSKKNHLNYFMRNIPHKYVPLTKDLIQHCLDFNKRLIDYKDLNSFSNHLIEAEEIALKEALLNMDHLNCKGGAILIDNEVQAFTLGGKLYNDTIVVHIEKANPTIKGLYQAINNEFCKNECIDIKYINREEDMGLENLRKAKLSYRPYKMVEKFNVTFI